MKSEHQGTYQMLWDCPNCETKKLLAVTHRHCPHCGAAQDPARRYFPSDEEKVAVEDHVYVGADWTCPACDTPNSAAADFCVNCGSGKDGSREVKRRSDQVAAAGSGFSDDSSKQARQELVSRPQGPSTAAATPPRRSLRWVLWVVLAVIALGAVLLFWKKEASLTVAGHTWRREIEIETFQPVRADDWRDNLPARAYDISCRREVRSHRQVEDGEECTNRRRDKGDGTFDEVRECRPKYRDEPVYDQKCRYTIDRWQRSRTAEASGESLAEPRRWPEVRLGRTGTCLGCEREGRRTEKYTVRLVETGAQKTHDCDFPEVRWASFAIGGHWKGKAGVLTGALDCEALEPSR